METTARNATLPELAELLADQHSRKVDVVAPAARLRSENGLLVVEGSDPILTPEGVTQADGTFRPTEVFDEGLSSKLNIPRAYLRRLRDERPDILDANVNGWLRGNGPFPFQNDLVGPDARSFLVRAFKGDDGDEGIARAFLSDSYRIVDNLDVLHATLVGVRNSGVEATVTQADLTDRRMYLKFQAPAVAELAPELLKGYRSPFTGATGDENPTVFAGFIVSNSETGNGRFTITPQVIVQICNNGMTITRDVLAKTHLGQKLEHGVIQWSDETLQRNLELVTLQARDAVKTFLDIDYLRAKIGQLTEKAAESVNTEGIQTITATLGFSEAERTAVLDSFVQGGQLTLGGVAQAVSAAAQGVDNADRAHELEAVAASVLVG